MTKNSAAKIILIGNPNVGKSVIFYRLTGQYATVSNYPGTTVEISKATITIGKKHYEVIDTPGINSLWAQSEDEKVTLSIIKDNPDAIILQVADSKNLQRTLLLALQLLELRMPFILALNLYDEAIEYGIKINTEAIKDTLKVPVVKTVAITAEGIGKLKHAIDTVANQSMQYQFKVSYPSEIIAAQAHLKKYNLPDGFDLILLGTDESNITFFDDENLKKDIRKIKEKFVRPISEVLFELYYKTSLEITATSSSTAPKSSGVKSRILESLGYSLMKPFFGYIFAVFILYLMYQFVGIFAAGTIVDFLEKMVFGKLVNPAVTSVFNKLLISGFIRELFIGDYGIITMALTYAIAIILPIVGAFFIFFGLLEDSGYIPRLAALLDRFFRVIGLNGKAVLPMILGFGCGTMATLTTRILEEKRERIIATLLLSLAIPCSAQLGVILGILASQSLSAFFIWFFTILIVFSATGYLTSKILPGITTPFVIEIPPLRMPMFSNILLKVKQRTLWYLKEAVPLFILGTFILFIFDRFGVLSKIILFLEPLVKGVLGLPPKAAESFLVGFLRRDYGAAGLFDLVRQGLLDKRQIVVSIVTITLFVPCLAQFLVTIKERGKVTALFIFIFVWSFSFAVGGVLNQILTLISYGNG